LTGWRLCRSTIQRWKRVGKSLQETLVECLKIPSMTWNILYERLSHRLYPPNLAPI
jgi:hypothetical protein